MTSKQGAGKSRRRGSERRKEKSRDAARCRRSHEAKIFSDLTDLLPLDSLPASCPVQIDKASVMRLTLGLLKLKKVLSSLNIGQSASKYDGSSLDASDGFILIVSRNSEIIYISNNVMNFLGIPFAEFIGQSLYEFTHPCEKLEIQSVFNEKDIATVDSYIRMKTTLTSRGRSVNLKSALYKVVHWHGSYMRLENGETAPLVLHCQTLPDFNSLNSRLSMSSADEAFMTQHTMSMKIIHCDENVQNFLGYTQSEILNRSFYELYHAADGEMLAKSLKKMFSSGQVKTEPYRFLSKDGGYAWVVTTANVIYDEVRAEATGVVCLHEVISGIEEEDEILSLPQLIPLDQPEITAPVLSTESVFCPLTEITDDSMKVEFDINSESLEHLAPHAGDTCVPLGFPPIPALGTMTNERPLEVLDIADQRLSSPESGPRVTPIVWEPLTVETGTDWSDASLSPDYPPSEGFSVLQESFPVSPVSNGYPSPDPGEPFNKFSPLFESKTNDDVLALEMRAPYIPMDEDWMLPFAELPKCSDINKYQSGISLGVDPMLSEVCFPLSNIQTPPRPKEPNVRYVRCLVDCENIFEITDEPKAKVARKDTILPKPKEPAKNQVLMNLLTRGEDRNYGYKLEEPPGHLERKRSLPKITPDDAEVNAPVPTLGSLLTGQQLLDALDGDFLIG